MLEFNPFVLLFWIFITSFIPGAILSISILKRTELNTVEKVLTGFGIGLLVPPIILTIFAILGIPYSFMLAAVSVILFYIIAIALLIKEKPFEGFSLNLKLDFNKQNLIALFLIIIVFLSFWIRFQTYSPVFQELDPYFYTYCTYQVLTLGHSVYDDGTAWYPEAVSNHLRIPSLVFLEASWYSFLTQGDTNIDNYLLADVAGIYPPIAAAFAVFFLYLFVSSQYKREFGVIAAGIASFLPILTIKLMAGEMEVQPYAFFTLAFFFAMYAFAIKDKSKIFAGLAGLSLAGLALGSASFVVALAALLIFIPLQALFIFFKENSEALKEFIILNVIVFLIGSLLGSFILNGLYTTIDFRMSYLLSFAAVLIFSGILYFVKEKVSEFETSTYIVAGILIVSSVLFLFTPVGDQIKSVAKTGLGIAEFKVPLHRTIAEQPVAGGVLEGQLGFIGANLKGGIGETILAPFTFIMNLTISLSLSVLNAIFGTSLSLIAKQPSLFLLVFFLFIVYLVYSFYRSINHKMTLWLLFLAVLLPGTLIGLIKLKYTIYAGFFIAAMAGIVLGEIDKLLEKYKDKFKPDIFKALTYAIILVGALIVLFQYNSNFLAGPLLESSMDARFQDDPAAFQSKFKSICSQFSMRGISEQQMCSEYYAAFGVYPCSNYDTDICLIAEDPVRYADLGTEEHFSTKLCYYSLIDDIFNPSTEEILAATYRCQRLTPYWIDSMEWIRFNTENDARVTSWWDYGHWINYFGLKNAVVRNEHVSTHMIGEVAHGYVAGSIDELKEIMNRYDSEYILIDGASDGIVRTKFGALNYLSCARNNETSVEENPGSSACEAEHMWEMIYLPQDETARMECTISDISGQKGVVASSSKYGEGYCLGTTTLVDGSTVFATYYLDKKYANGDLMLNKAFIPQGPTASGGWEINFDQTFAASDPSGIQRNILAVTVYYTEDPIWLENGEVKNGYEDRKGKYYDSVLYKGYYLENLPGFDLVYRSSGNEVKIYKLR